jgi:hypothetical protein
MSRTGDYVPVRVRKKVIERTRNRCEYCLTPDDDPFTYLSHQIDHIKSLRHRGDNSINNLAYACFYCNSGKGADLGSVHDLTGEFAFFYNPRVDNWRDHFEMLDDFWISLLTPTDWVTVIMLGFNVPARVEARRLLLS